MHRILTGLAVAAALYLWAAIASAGLDLQLGSLRVKTQKLINPGFAFVILLVANAFVRRRTADEDPPAPVAGGGWRTLVACWLFLIVPVAVLAWGRAVEGDFIREDFQRIAAIRAGQPLNGTCWPDARFNTFWSRQSSLVFDQLTYPWFGLDARKWHALNIALHLVVALATGFLSLALTRRCASAVLAAALLALAPWATEAVCWIAARDDAFAALYGLLAALALVKAVRAPGYGVGWTAASVAATVLALFAKESALSMPGALAVVAWLAQEEDNGRPASFEWRSLARAVGRVVPHGVALVIYLVVRGRMLAVQGWDPDETFTDWPKVLLWPLSPLGPLAFAVNMLELPALAPLARAGAGAMMLGALAVALSRFRALVQRASVGFYLMMLMWTVPVYRMIHLSATLQNNRYVYLPGLAWALLFGHLLAVNASAWRRFRLVPLFALGAAFALVRVNAMSWVTAGVVAGQVREDLKAIVEPLAKHEHVRVDGLPDQWHGAFLFNLADVSGPLIAFHGMPPEHRFRLVELYHTDGVARPPPAPGPEFCWRWPRGFVRTER